MTALAPGTSAEMAARRITFTVPAGMDPICLIVGVDGRVRSGADVAFYNQPAIPGITVQGDSAVIDADSVERGATIHCAASTDSGPVDGARCRLAAPNSDLAVDIPGIADTGAVVCAKLAWRQDHWRIDAVADEYSGLAQLLVDHGADVTGPEPGRPAAERDTSRPKAGDAPLAGDFRSAMNRALAIFEDAARSAAGYVAAVEHAHARLDAELSASLDDPATRTGDGAARARAEAQQRADNLEAAAQQRFDADSQLLMAELHAIDPQLPPAMASWESVSWFSPADRLASGVRIGELSAPDRGPLRIPFCVPTPLARGVWALAGAGQSAEPVLTSLAVRLIAAGDRIEVDLIDPVGGLPDLHRLLTPFFAGPVVGDSADIAPRLADLESAMDLTDMQAQTSVHDDDLMPAARLLIVNDLPFGWDQSAQAHLLRIVERAPSVGWSVLIAGDLAHAESDPLLMTIADHCMPLPLSDEGTAHDPWVGLLWSVRPDALDPRSEHATRLVAALAARR
ncbi:TerD family protein [Jongsikchunia kroppenstedtii]|uniref:TerD family protein n=1 Tax=Jongsikchunia kroppenstedtii TaxID=1121721 RepID=UPI00036DD509|nr:TerD family protein [Jongsikchunia kroppenstedtii]